VFSSNFSAHKTPAEFVEWAIDRRGDEWYNELKDKKNTLSQYKDVDFEELMGSIL
jgi:hypothetical protein